jgi:hypothetical protein
MGVICLRAEAGSWELSTADTRAVIGIAGAQPVILHLQDTKTGHEWAGDGMRVPLLSECWLAGREQPLSWQFRRASMNQSAHTLTLTFENGAPHLVLRSLWQARPGRGPIEHWATIENRSGALVAVGCQQSLTLDSLHTGGPATLWWMRRGGSNASTEGGIFAEPLKSGLDLDLASNCDSGSSPVPWISVQVEERHGLYVGWEFSGPGRVHVHAGSDPESLSIAAGCRPDFKTDIQPGERLLVPAAFVGCYAGDIEEGSYSLHRFIVEKLRPAMPQGYSDPTLAYNLYLDAGGPSAKEADVLRSAQFCRDLGFETFMPDAMWFPECGDWRWDPKRFPNGVTPIEEFVHKAGMKLALWCAWTNGGISADPGALSVRGPAGNPDWFNSGFPPDWKPGPFYGGRVCLACREAKEWEIRKTQWLASNHKLDYLKHDCGPIVNDCDKTDHRHHYGVDAGYWATLGYYEVQERLRKACPRLVLENCSGGGHIKDFGIIQHTHYTVTTDTLSNLPDRQSLYDSTYAFPPILLQAYTYERAYGVPGDDPGPFLWRSGMMGAWQIDPTDTRKWTGEERESARRSAEIYKKWIRPILQDAKVFHVLPRPDGVHWDGMFYWSPRRKQGTLYIFRPHAAEDSITVKLKGLESGHTYRIRAEDGSLAAGTRTGAELMTQGLVVRLPHRYTSDLVYVEDAQAAPSTPGAPNNPNRRQ